MRRPLLTLWPKRSTIMLQTFERSSGMEKKNTQMKKPTKPKQKHGRPRKEISMTEFEKLCGMQCTKEEIAAFFECDEDTINNWCKREYNSVFSVVYAQKRENGRISLRRKQWNLATGSPAMAIFLGKQYLGQRDKYEVTNENELAKLDEIMKEIKKGI